jgi:hypothetical protein
MSRDTLENTNSNSNSPEYECENKKINLLKFSSQKMGTFVPIFCGLIMMID